MNIIATFSVSEGVSHSIDWENWEDEPRALLEAGSVYQLFSSRVRKLASAIKFQGKIP